MHNKFDKKKTIFGVICFLPWLLSIIIDYSRNLEFLKFYLSYITCGLIFGLLGFTGLHIHSKFKNKNLALFIKVLVFIIALIPGILVFLVHLYGLFFPITEI